MNKENVLFSIVGVLVGFIVGFVFANTANRAGVEPQAGAVAAAQQQAEGLPLRDPDSEQTLVRELQDHKPGPLSTDGVAELFRHVLELTRKELHGA